MGRLTGRRLGVLAPSQGLILGLALFGAAWLWSLVTSLQIIRDLRKTTPPILRDP